MWTRSARGNAATLVLSSLATLACAGACSSGLDGLHDIGGALQASAGGAGGASGASVAAGGQAGTSASGGSDGGHAGDLNAGGAGCSGSPSASCDPSAGFTADSFSWHVREGDDDTKATTQIGFERAGTPLSSFAISAVGAPAWARVSMSPAIDGVSLSLSGPIVPFDARPAPATFQLVATRTDQPSCSSTITVHLDVTNLLHATAELAPMSGALAAAYQPTRDRFVLLDAAAGRLVFLDTKGSAPTNTPISFVAIPGVIAVSDDHVYVLSASTLHRLDADGNDDQPIDLTSISGVPSLASANGVVVLGQDAGPTRAVRDASTSAEDTSLPANVRHVTSDGAGFFAFDVQNATGIDVWTAPAQTLAGTSCSAPPSVGPPSIGGGRTGLVYIDAKGMLVLTNDVGACNPVGQTKVAAAPPYSSALAITGDLGLTVTNLTDIGGQTELRVDLLDLAQKTALGDPLDGYHPTSASNVYGIVAGGRHALVLISSPVLLEL